MARRKKKRSKGFGSARAEHKQIASATVKSYKNATKHFRGALARGECYRAVLFLLDLTAARAKMREHAKHTRPHYRKTTGRAAHASAEDRLVAKFRAACMR